MIRRTLCVLGSVASAAILRPAAAQTAAEYPAPVAPPPVARALLPGHWQLDGARYVWVPPETRLRVVQGRPLVVGQNVWRDGRWVFVPTHYAPPY
jgi:hypothetical protein